MESSTASTALPQSAPWRDPMRWLLPLLLALYAAILIRYMGACAGGSDSSGYLNNARLLAAGRVILPMRLVPGVPPETLPPYTHVPLGFIPNPDHVTMTPTYPMGLPLLLVAGAAVVGWGNTPGTVIAIHALAGLWLVFLLGRKAGLERGWAFAGALLLGVSPIYIQMSVQLMSDVPALVWVTAAVVLAWASRTRITLAIPAGFCLGIAVLVRPTNALALVPVLIAAGPSLRRALGLVAGGLPATVFLGVFNHAAYGRVLTTGYGAVGSEFAAAYIPGSLLHYAVWLPVLLTPLVALAAGLPALARRRPDAALVLGSWVLVFAAFYACYRYTPIGWWSFRFLLPAFPPLIVASLLVARQLAARNPASRRRLWGAVAAVAIVIYGIAWTRHFVAHHAGFGEKVYPRTAAWIQENLPPNAVVASMQTSGALFYYTPLTLFRYDMMSAADCRRVADASTAAGRPVYAVLFPFEIDDPDWAAFRKHLTGHWIQVGAVRQASIWKYEPSASN